MPVSDDDQSNSAIGGFSHGGTEDKMAKSPIKIVLFMGSAREGRMCDRVTEFMKGHLVKNGFEVDVFDPIKLEIPVLQNPIHFYPDQSKVPKWLVDLNGRIQEAEGYVVISAEYNNTIPPALTNMMDHFSPNSYAFKPSLIVNYSMGKLGGCIASGHLRAFTSVIGCPSVPFALPIAEVHTALDASGTPLNENLDKLAEKAVGQLRWMASAFKEKKERESAPIMF